MAPPSKKLFGSKKPFSPMLAMITPLQMNKKSLACRVKISLVIKSLEVRIIEVMFYSDKHLIDSPCFLLSVSFEA